MSRDLLRSSEKLFFMREGEGAVASPLQGYCTGAGF